MILLKLIIVGQRSRLLFSYSRLTISTEQYSVNSSVCKLTSSGPTLVLSTQTPSVNSQDLYPDDFYHSKIRNQLTTGDWGATHKLKPRSFSKSFSTLISLTVRQSLLSGFAITVKYYLFSEIVQYIVPEYNSIITLFLHSPSVRP